jgi:aminoglycoside phosphotransferase (APT) family kinase protein
LNATIGDPLLDLATCLRLLENGGRVHGGERESLIARWEEISGRRAPDLRYWTALSAYKHSILVEGVYRRALADPTRGEAQAIGDTALRIQREALEVIRG